MKLTRRSLLSNAAALTALSSASACQIRPHDALNEYDAVGVAEAIRENIITPTDAVEAATEEDRS